MSPAVLDELGRLLDTASFAATPAGYRRLNSWLCGHGEVLAVGVEGTGSWGAGLSRFLRARGVNVIEVNRTNRQTRRRKGKTDTVDAEAAARAVLAGDATVIPKSGDGPIESVRQLRVARHGAMKARTAAANQMHSLTDTAPDELRTKLRGLTTLQRARTCARLRVGDALTPTGAAKIALRAVASRWLSLHEEILELSPRNQAYPRHDRRTNAHPSRRRLRNDRRAAVRGRRQPRTAQHRRQLRRALWIVTRRDLFRPDETTPSQPCRRPPRQRRALDMSWSASAATTHRPSTTSNDAQPKASANEKPSGASNATSPARSTTTFVPSPPPSTNHK